MLSRWPQGEGPLGDGDRAQTALPKQPFPRLIQLYLAQNSFWLLQINQDIPLLYSGKCLSLGTAAIPTKRGSKDQGLLWVGCVPVLLWFSWDRGPTTQPAMETGLWLKSTGLRCGQAHHCYLRLGYNRLIIKLSLIPTASFSSSSLAFCTTISHSWHKVRNSWQYSW